MLVADADRMLGRHRRSAEWRAAVAWAVWQARAGEDLIRYQRVLWTLGDW